MSLTNDQLAELTNRINARLAEFDIDEGEVRKPYIFERLNRGAVRLYYAVIVEWQQAQEPKASAISANGNGWGLVTDADGRVRERAPWQDLMEQMDEAIERQAIIERVVADEPTDDDPAMPDLSGGVDRFAEHPVAGEPEPPVADRPIGRDRTQPATHSLPDPDVARERLAGAIANGDLDIGAHGQPTPPRLDARGRPIAGKRGNVLPTREELVAFVREIAMAGVMPTKAQFDDARPGNWATAAAQLLRLKIDWEDVRSEAGLKPNPRVAARIEA